jgi:SP family general alpha glucoside:H+ symporter-like MFS transporter
VQLNVETMGENSAVTRLAETSGKFAELNAGAKVATDAEHAMSLREGLRQYPKAIAWSVIFSLAIAMEGYDKALIGGFFAFKPFVDKFGQDGPNGRQVAAYWQASLNNGARAGEIMGLLLNGIIVERYGFRKTMIGALALLTCFIFIPVFAQNIQTLLVADILMGIPWGVFQTLTPAYAVEVTPVALRGYLATYVNANWGFGQLISAGVLRALMRRNDEWAFRIPYALQWMWPVPLMIALWFAPESPWWLVRRGRHEDAKVALQRLSTNKTDEEIADTVASM